LEVNLKVLYYLKGCINDLVHTASQYFTIDLHVKWPIAPIYSTVGGETRNEAVTVMWKKHFAAQLNSSNKCENGNFVRSI